MLGFLNKHTNSILFFNLEQQQLEHQIVFSVDGPNATGKVRSFTVINKDSIIAVMFGRTVMYLVDWNGQKLQEIDFTRSSAGEPLLWTEGYSFYFSPVIFKEYKLYLTQLPIHVNKLCVEINLKDDSIKLLPFAHPNRDDRSVENNMFCRDFDGKNFVYSFEYDHNVYVTSDHRSYITRPAKSDAINILNPIRHSSTPTIEQGAKAVVESSHYRSIIYDRYRKVYYRFVHLGVKTVKGDDLNLMNRYYRRFSIVILNQNLEKIGEYFSPDNWYNMNMVFVGKEGLYVSTNHILNPDYDENYLSFELFTLQNVSPNGKS